MAEITFIVSASVPSLYFTGQGIFLLFNCTKIKAKRLKQNTMNTGFALPSLLTMDCARITIVNFLNKL